jgi:hypothetical protein
MALDLTSLTRRDALGHVGDGPGSVKYEYGYVTGDLPAVTDAAGYFNAANAFLQVADIIRCVNGVPGTPTTKVYTVVTNTGGVVTVA